MKTPIPDVATLDPVEFAAPLRGLIHALHREGLRERVERARFSRRAAAQKGSRPAGATKQ